MAGISYHQFDMHIKIEQDNLILRHTPRISEQIKNFDDFIDELDERFEDEFATMELQQKNGQFLFDKIFPPASGLRKAFSKAIEENQRVRLRLLYPPNSDQLLKIPWEYLFAGPEKPDRLSGFLCQRSDFSVVHCMQKTNDGVLADDALPLKVAFLSALETAEASLASLNRLLEVNSAVVNKYSSILRINRHAEEVQLSNFRSALKNDVVAQFLIHGGPDAIYFKSADGQITGQEIMAMLDDIASHKVQAVVLCACEGAQQESGPSIQLHKRGIPVVVGFRKPLNTKKAIRFMEDFYSELVNTAGSVEEALAFARTGLIHQDNGFFTLIAEDTPLSLDWGVPRIFLTRSNGNLISDELLYRPVYPRIWDRFQEEITRRLKKASEIEELTNSPEYPPELDQWLTGAQRIHYLYAPSGTGKSTQIARFFDKHKNEKRILIHLCTLRGNQVNDENVNHPLIFVRDSLYPQLETLFGKEQYRAWVGRRYPYLIDNARDAFQQLIIEPLRKARNSNKWEQPILIIDGVDSAKTFEPGYTILDLLSDFIQPLTEVMRLLITANADANEDDVHQRILGLLGENNNRGAALKLSVSVDWAKLQDEMNLRIPQNVQSIFNNFLTTRKNAGDINYQFISFIKRIDEPKLLQKIVRESLASENYLDSTYQTTWEFIQGKARVQKIKLTSIFKVLGAAYAPLPLSMLAALVNEDPQEILHLLDELSYFIQQESEEVSCEHPSIKQYIGSISSPQDNLDKLFLDMYLRKTDEGNDWSKLEGENDGRVLGYAAQYFSEHAYRFYIEEREADFRDGQDQYLKLMLSPSFRKFRRGNKGEAAFEDVRRILRIFYIRAAIENLQSKVKSLLNVIPNLIYQQNTIIPVDDVWKAGNGLMAAATTEKILGSSGRYTSPQLVALEKELRDKKEGDDLFGPLQKFWSLYYPTLFPKSAERL